VLNADPDLPSLTTLRDWRRAEPEFDGGLRFAMQVGRRARARARAVAWQETLTARIREGASLASLGREADTPSKATLYRWAGKHPEFAREIAQACDDRQHWYLDQIAEIAEAVTPGTVKETRQRMSPLTRRLGQLSQRPGKKWLG
jgi:terminase small subunit-like protein